MNILTIGGSRNIGYFASIRFLDAGCTVTFLLRSAAVFDQNETIQRYVLAGKAILVQGDALVQSDVQRAWEEATKHGNVDLLLFTVGGQPKFSISKGAYIEPANLVTASLFNALTTMPRTEPLPRVVALSSAGVTHASHAALPSALKPVYSLLLGNMHVDKIAMERLVAHCAGWDWNPADFKRNAGEPSAEIMGRADWKNTPGLPESGTLNRALIVRPGHLTDGECKADLPGSKGGRNAYRASEDALGGWGISRQDVAHFVVDAVSNRWNEFEGKCVTVVY